MINLLPDNPDKLALFKVLHENIVSTPVRIEVIEQYLVNLQCLDLNFNLDYIIDIADSDDYCLESGLLLTSICAIHGDVSCEMRELVENVVIFLAMSDLSEAVTAIDYGKYYTQYPDGDADCDTSGLDNEINETIQLFLERFEFIDPLSFDLEAIKYGIDCDDLLSNFINNHEDYHVRTGSGLTPNYSYFTSEINDLFQRT